MPEPKDIQQNLEDQGERMLDPIPDELDELSTPSRSWLRVLISDMCLVTKAAVLHPFSSTKIDFESGEITRLPK